MQIKALRQTKPLTRFMAKWYPAILIRMSMIGATNDLERNMKQHR